MQPELNLGPVTLQTFGMMFALAFVASGVVVGKRFSELGKPVDWAYEALFAALVGGLIGARLHFIVENWDEASEDLLGNIFSGEGLVFYGGAVGGAVGVSLWALWRGYFGLRMLDGGAPALAIGYAVGRVGCQLSGDGDYGIASGLPWAMPYPDGTVATNQEVHPTPIYESLTMGFVAWLLWTWRDRFRPGVLFAWWMLFAGTERFLVEFIRRNDEVLAGLTAPQLQSLALAAGGALWLAIASRRGGLRKAPPSAAPPSAASA